MYMARSKLEESVDFALSVLYPRAFVEEEFSLRLPSRKIVYVDRMIPSVKLAIECDGRQHTEFVPFFHKNIAEFYQGNIRDSEKDEALRRMGYVVVRVPWDAKVTPMYLRSLILASYERDSDGEREE